MERKKFILPTALILGLLVVNEVSVANAAYVFDNNAAVTEITGGLSGGGAGFGTTFQTQLSNLSKGLLASAKIIAVIMSGAAVIAPYAVNLTLLLAMIDGAIKVAFDLISGDKVKFLVMMILKVGFFIFLIHSWIGTNLKEQ